MMNKIGLKQIGLIIAGLGIVLLVLPLLTDLTRTIKTLSYTDFLDQVEKGAVKEVYVEGQFVYGRYKDDERFEAVVAESNQNWDILRKHNVNIMVGAESSYLNYWILTIAVLFLLVCALLWYLYKQAKSIGGGGGNNIFSMGKSKVRMFMPSTIKETFDSVAGAVEAKEELADVVDFLKSPKKYQRLGAKITKGVLLIGEPGNGKTLLARAVAGEANCPFFSISGSDFIEVFVGVGAARVRDLFATARKHAPSIIFIDEIDAVGRQRGGGYGGGNDEREQTLNQLLTEMDGFTVYENPVVVIAATNRPDVLDKALLRTGRFDRSVSVPYPDLISREAILSVHAAMVKMDGEVDLQKIARGTPGFSGADLANLINEAAIMASKRNDSAVASAHLEEARDKMLLGKEMKTVVLSDHEKAVTAYHEAGHALVTLLLPEHTDPLHKITIIPRGKAMGVTHFMPEREKYMRSREEMIASIMTSLGGRAAEQLVFNSLMTGAYTDFQNAMSIVHKMVYDYGMDPELGAMQFRRNEFGEPIYSEKTAEKIDAAMKRIIDTCYEDTLQLLTNSRDKLDALAQALLEKETLYAGQVYELLGIEPRVEHKFI
jgi:cell division protease FtsH